MLSCYPCWLTAVTAVALVCGPKAYARHHVAFRSPRFAFLPIPFLPKLQVSNRAPLMMQAEDGAKSRVQTEGTRTNKMATVRPSQPLWVHRTIVRPPCAQVRVLAFSKCRGLSRLMKRSHKSLHLQPRDVCLELSVHILAIPHGR